MRLTRLAATLFAAAVGTFLSASVQGAFTYTPVSDTGSLMVTALPPLQVASAPISSPYGPPVITPIASGWKLTFAPTASFFAAANNSGGAQNVTTVMDGQLTFEVSFDAPVRLTLNIFEDGIFNKTGPIGASIASVAGGGSVTPLAPNPVDPAHINGNLAGGAVFNSNTGGWSSFLQISGTSFQQAYTSYRISVDNILTAEALVNQSFATAIIAKKDFTLFLTTDGSSGGGPPVPEPASLGLLGMGGLALLARRRQRA